MDGGYLYAAASRTPIMTNEPQFQASLTSTLEALRTRSESELEGAFASALRVLVTSVPADEREEALRVTSAWCLVTLPPASVSRAVGSIVVEQLAILHNGDADDSDGPAFLDALPANAPLPTHITTTSARELYGQQPGETLAQALERSRGEASR